ncbi:MAG TPA: hypothetical protein VFD49_16990 [Candidatus Dormibacteraeota bacterium]|nr:hypothetical protein [Candidatus Dormibacteraeota bacterium]
MKITIGSKGFSPARWLLLGLVGVAVLAIANASDLRRYLQLREM